MVRSSFWPSPRARRIAIGSIVAAVAISAAPALGATYYVRQGASGANNGTSWASAWPSFASINWAVIGPGDTVEIAGGTYSSPLLVSASGLAGQRVTVRRTTEPAYAGLVDIRAYVDITGNYVTVDGSVANGIRVKLPASGYVDDHHVRSSGTGMTLRRIEIAGPGYKQCHLARGIQTTSDSLSMDEVYIHDFSAPAIRLNGNDGVTISRSKLHNILSAGDTSCNAQRGVNVHFEHIAVFGGVRNFEIESSVLSQDYEGTSRAGGFGISVALMSGGYLRVHDNVFFNMTSAMYINSDGLGAVSEYKVNGNTFVGFRTPISGTPNEVKNNVFCNLPAYFDQSSNRNAYYGGDHNLYCYDLATYVASYQQAASSQVLAPGEDPFVAYTSDWRLALATNAGATLPAPYTNDLLGNSRGADGVWDRGAYEYLAIPTTCGASGCEPGESCRSCPSDCGACCGNGVIDLGESCDPPASCPTVCDDLDACTTNTLGGSAGQCTVQCSYTPVTSCVVGDGCCPAGCTSATDADCTSSCGAGGCEPGESCQSCPSDCGACSSYTAPVIERLSGACNGDLTLAWSVPASANGEPDGGFDLWVDGVDTNLTHRTTAHTTTVSGLAPGTPHCFQVQARWTEAAPVVLMDSAPVCGEAPSCPACGDGACAGTEEDCATCAVDCGARGAEVCCGATLFPGDCCSDVECSAPDTCSAHMCAPPACQDADNDGYGVGSSCGGTDCDDGQPATHAGAAESCDGRDNDCDGQVDEDWPELGMECTAGAGLCQVSRRSACAADGSGATCPPGQLEAAELSRNGGLELFTGDVAEEWSTAAAAGTMVVASEDAGRTGACQRLEVSALDGWGLVFYQQARLELGASYHLSLWYRTTAEMHARLELGNATATLVTARRDLPSTGGAWMPVELDFTHDNAGADRVRISTQALGALWVDDVSLRRVVPAPEPQAELCNGVDDDCDGSVDEGCDEGGVGGGCACSAAGRAAGWSLALLALAIHQALKRCARQRSWHGPADRPRSRGLEGARSSGRATSDSWSDRPAGRTVPPRCPGAE